CRSRQEVRCARCSPFEEGTGAIVAALVHREALAAAAAALGWAVHWSSPQPPRSRHLPPRGRSGCPAAISDAEKPRVAAGQPLLPIRDPHTRSTYAIHIRDPHTRSIYAICNN